LTLTSILIQSHLWPTES